MRLIVFLLIALIIAGCGRTEVSEPVAKAPPAPELAADKPVEGGPSLISKEELEKGIDVGELI